MTDVLSKKDFIDLINKTVKDDEYIVIGKLANLSAVSYITATYNIAPQVFELKGKTTNDVLSYATRSISIVIVDKANLSDKLQKEIEISKLKL